MQVLREPYLAGNSLVHRLDPRLKLIGVLAYILVASALPHGAWVALAVLAALAAGVVALAHLPWHILLKRVGLALPFVGLVVLSVPFVRGGTPLIVWQWGPVQGAITREGLAAMGEILTKAWLSLWMSVLLVATTPLPALAQGLWRLRVPPLLCTIFTFMIRYLYVLAEEAARLQTARAARSAGGGRTVFWRARVLGGMIGSLFLRSLARAERIYAAMLARGYAGEPRWLDRLSWQSVDTCAACVWAVLLLSVTGLALFTA